MSTLRVNFGEKTADRSPIPCSTASAIFKVLETCHQSLAMCRRACQLVHGPFPEVIVISQAFCHMQTVEMHLALPSASGLCRAKSAEPRVTRVITATTATTVYSNTTIVTSTTFTLVMICDDNLIPDTESGSLVLLCPLVLSMLILHCVQLPSGLAASFEFVIVASCSCWGFEVLNA